MIEEQTPTLQTVLSSAISSHLAEVRQCLPARVDSYDASKHRLTATPLILEGYVTANGERATEGIPAITNIPVIFPGSGSTRVRWPINPGDTVLLLFSSTSLDKWLVRGGTVDPQDDRRHNISDCIAIPGFQDFAHVTEDSVQIEFTQSGQIHAGGSSPLAKNSDLLTLVNAIKAANASIGAEPAFAALFSALSSAFPSPSTPAGTIVLKGA